MKKALLVVFFLSFLGGAIWAQSVPIDSVTVTEQGNCCFDFTVKNRNAGKWAITDFHIKVTTPGVTIRATPQAPSGWIVKTWGPDSVYFEVAVGAPPLQSGKNLSGFIVCFNQNIGSFNIRWRTTRPGDLVGVPITITTGAIDLSCKITCDDVTIDPQGGCCFTWVINNNNSLNQNIDDFHLQIATPGVTFTSVTTPNGWSVSSQSTTNVQLTGPNKPVKPGNSLGGFKFCFKVGNPGTTNFTVEWRTTSKGKLICSGTEQLHCAYVPPPRDTVSVDPYGDCCFDFLVKNRNNGQSILNDFHIKVLTPNVTVRPTPSAPMNWSIPLWNSSEIFWQTTQGASGIMPGDALNGFKACFDNKSSSSMFEVEWTTTFQGKPVSVDTLRLQCEVIQQCDSIDVMPIPGAKCCYSLTLKNRHTPPGPLNDFHVTVLSPNVTISSANGPWPQTLNPTNVTFSTVTSALSSGDDLGGFNICLKNNSTNAVIQLLVQTTLSGKEVCTETITVDCEPEPTGCDSVKVKPLGDCCYELALTNLHQPPGPLNDFHLEILTPGVGFDLPPSSPYGWTVSSSSFTDIMWVDTLSALKPGASQDGFVFCFNDKASGVIKLLWSSTLDGKTICSDTIEVVCYTRCDTLEAKPIVPSDECCFDLTLKNRHFPFGPLNDLHLRITDSTVNFSSPPVAPVGWVLSSWGARKATFIDTSGVIPPGGSQSGFVICLRDSLGNVPSTNLAWYSTYMNKIVCKDTIPLECKPVQQGCDTVRIIQKAPNDCCFDFEVLNRNSSNMPIYDLHFIINAPGVTVRPTPLAPAGWTVSSFTTNTINYQTTSSPIPPGGSLAGFKACFDVGPNAPIPFMLYWRTTGQGIVICRDSLRIVCEPTETRCDSVSLKSVPDAAGLGCCFEATLFNVHTPPTPLSSWEIKVLTGGVTVRPTPSAASPWSVASWTSTQILFTTTSPLPPGGSQPGFAFCFDNIPAGGSFVIEWTTTDISGVVVCKDTIRLQCPPGPTEECDSVMVKPMSDDCCYDLTVKNRNAAHVGINDFHIKVISGNATVRPTPIAPAGWNASFTSTSITYTAGTAGPIPPGGDLSGFVYCFDRVPGTGGPIKLLWQTTQDKQVICEDTLLVDCKPVPQQCDRVSSKIQSQEKCCHEFIVANFHLPPSPITDFHLRVLTPSVNISNVSGPTGWTSNFSNAPVVANFATNTAPIPTSALQGGFVVCFKPTKQLIKIEWITTLKGKVICKDTLTVICDTTTGIIRLDDPVPTEFGLNQNYPNPFGEATPWGLPATTIEFALPKRALVTLEVFNSAGQLVWALEPKAYRPGKYAVTINAQELPSGTYYYRLSTEGFTKTLPMVILR